MRATLLGLVVVVASTGTVVLGALRAPAPEARRAATEDERRDLAASIAAEEPGWREAAETSWPDDAWSQSDDFHSRESQQAGALAAKHGVRIEDVLRAIDEDLHRHGADARTPNLRGARVVPCKPRPIYD